MKKLSVCLSVKRVDRDKTEERSVQIIMPYERSFSLVSWEEWLVGATPSTWNFGSVVRPHRWAAAVRSAAAVCYAVWSCWRTVMEQWTIAVDTTCLPRTRGHHPDTRQVTSRAVHRPSSFSLASSTLTMPVWRSYRKRIVDLAGTRSSICCCFRTAPTTFIWISRTTVREVGRHYRTLLLTTDAARRQGLNVVLCSDRLFQQYIVDACAKMEQQRLSYLRFNQNGRRSWRCSDEWRRSRRSPLRNFMHNSL